MSNETTIAGTVTVDIRKNYGAEAIYPVCKTAKTFAEMVGRKTLTRRDIASIKALGFAILVTPNTVVL